MDGTKQPQVDTPDPQEEPPWPPKAGGTSCPSKGKRKFKMLGGTTRNNPLFHPLSVIPLF